MRVVLLLLISILGVGCASMKMLPPDASTVEFESQDGKTGWSEYRGQEIFVGYSSDQVFEAAKAGLEKANFKIRKAEKDKGVVVGEHGMTLFDWNVMAGVYFKQELNDTKVKVVVEGSKDFGVAGDATGSNWIVDILDGMRQHLAAAGEK